MRIAVLADIHGNHVALERCLAHAEAQGAEAYWFLGDYVGELPCPQRTMEALYAWAEK
ncbi:MAG: metallophosphoesterase family protein, partial [Clostridia bacterium]|nr:metallophosphoesterase family protein [Clostridia bacterium]